MECKGKVVGIEGGIARVRIESDACGGCKACGFSALRDRSSMEVNAQNRVGAEVDDVVQLEVSGRKVMWASAVLFMIPFLALVAGLMLGYYAIGPLLAVSKPLSAVVAGFALLAASYYLVYLFGSHSEFEFIITTVGEKK